MPRLYQKAPLYGPSYICESSSQPCSFSGGSYSEDEIPVTPGTPGTPGSPGTIMIPTTQHPLGSLGIPRRPTWAQFKTRNAISWYYLVDRDFPWWVIYIYIYMIIIPKSNNQWTYVHPVTTNQPEFWSRSLWYHEDTKRLCGVWLSKWNKRSCKVQLCHTMWWPPQLCLAVYKPHKNSSTCYL